MFATEIILISLVPEHLYNEIMTTARKHGHARKNNTSLEYRTWQAMMRRCYKPADSFFADYGGRGIKVCNRWHSFVNFLTDMGPKPSTGHSIDRYPDKDGNYTPGNCRWATMKQQARNTRRNRLVTYKGRTQCVAAWGEELGISERLLRQRLFKLGWNVEKAFTTFENPKHQQITFKSKTMTIMGWSRELGIPYSCLKQRLQKLHWTPRRALTTPLRG